VSPDDALITNEFIESQSINESTDGGLLMMPKEPLNRVQFKFRGEFKMYSKLRSNFEESFKALP